MNNFNEDDDEKVINSLISNPDYIIDLRDISGLIINVKYVNGIGGVCAVLKIEEAENGYIEANLIDIKELEEVGDYDYSIQ